MRIGAGSAPHAPDDHLELFSKLPAQIHEEMDVERLIFNFPAAPPGCLRPRSASSRSACIATALRPNT
jgi:hypothetical protein